MDDEKNIGFVPVKPVSAICSNLFSSGSFDNDSKSPMSELAVSLELSKVKIPRRRLTLSSDGGIPTPERSRSLSSEFSLDSVNSPLSECPDVDSPIIEYIRSKKTDMRRKCTARNFSSPIKIRKPLTPLALFNNISSSPFKNITSSPFKPVSIENVEEYHSDISICEMHDNFPDDFSDDFRIKKRKYAGRSHSAPTVSMDMDMDLYRGESCEDDGFFDDGLLQSGDNNMSPSCPTTYLGLIDAPMVHMKESRNEFTEADKENYAPCKDTSKNHVFQEPMELPFKKRSMSCSAKRNIPTTADSPNRFRTKKQKTKCGRSYSFYEGDPALRPIQPMCPLQPKDLNSPRTLQRSQSFDSHSGKSRSSDITSFDMDDKNLIGDKSRTYLLPTTTSKHPDLKGITPETLTALMDNAFKDDVVEHIIVDCRYPYEYDGGHIKGAVNIHDKPGMIDFFLKSPRPSTKEKRRVLIFHCEFSSKRGPAMCRFLRNKDRDIHVNYYPQLYYPEMYLLEGGYKEFYEKKKEYCEPQGYREMVDAMFHQELRLFNKRSKSWSEDNLRNRTSLRY